MRILQGILWVLIIALLALNALSYLNGGPQLPKTTAANTIGYLIGYNAPIILALILILVVLFIRKKIRKRKERKILDNFLQ